MISYASIIFENMTAAMPSGTGAMLLGCMQLAGTVASSQCIDRWGRRALLLLSTLLCSACMLAAGAFLWLQQSDIVDWDLAGGGWWWLPVGLTLLFTFFSALGITPVPYVLLAETLPARVRQTTYALCVVTTSVYSATVLHLFPHMLLVLGLSGCFFVFAAFAAVGFVFTWVCIVETKGISLE